MQQNVVIKTTSEISTDMIWKTSSMIRRVSGQGMSYDDRLTNIFTAFHNRQDDVKERHMFILLGREIFACGQNKRKRGGRFAALAFIISMASPGVNSIDTTVTIRMVMETKLH